VESMEGKSKAWEREKEGWRQSLEGYAR